MVYDDAARIYKEVEKKANALVKSSLKSLVVNGAGKSGSLISVEIVD